MRSYEIVGFCRGLGLMGFADFKIAPARDLAQAGLPVVDGQQNGTLIDNVFQSHAQNLAETLRVNPASVFEQVSRVSLALKHKNRTGGRLQKLSEELAKRRLS